MNADMTRKNILNEIDQLQNWFASRPYGFRENGSAGQRQQYNDRVRALDALIERLAAE